MLFDARRAHKQEKDLRQGAETGIVLETCCGELVPTTYCFRYILESSSLWSHGAFENLSRGLVHNVVLAHTAAPQVNSSIKSTGWARPERGPIKLITCHTFIYFIKRTRPAGVCPAGLLGGVS